MQEQGSHRKQAFLQLNRFYFKISQIIFSIPFNILSVSLSRKLTRSKRQPWCQKQPCKIHLTPHKKPPPFLPELLVHPEWRQEPLQGHAAEINYFVSCCHCSCPVLSSLFGIYYLKIKQDELKPTTSTAN